MSSFCKCKSYSHFFSKNNSIYAVFNDQSFNDTLTNDIVSFEQLGPDVSTLEKSVPDHCVGRCQFQAAVTTKWIRVKKWTLPSQNLDMSIVTNMDTSHQSRPGPSCSKLTMSLVNILLKLRSLNVAYTLIFLLKKCE